MELSALEAFRHGDEVLIRARVVRCIPEGSDSDATGWVKDSTGHASVLLEVAKFGDRSNFTKPTRAWVHHSVIVEHRTTPLVVGSRVRERGGPPQFGRIVAIDDGDAAVRWSDTLKTWVPLYALEACSDSAAADKTEAA